MLCHVISGSIAGNGVLCGFVQRPYHDDQQDRRVIQESSSLQLVAGRETCWKSLQTVALGGGVGVGVALTAICGCIPVPN
jgi:hypothetical protein